MKRITYLLFSMIILLAACTSSAAEPAAPETSSTAGDAQMTIEDSVVPQTAGNEQAARPQFIMFTASW